METDRFDYELPESLIAQQPADRRDASRLMVLNRARGSIEHTVFSDLPDYLQAGDVLVVNNSLVIPARLYGVKRATGAAIELLMANPAVGHDAAGSNNWLVMARPARRLSAGDIIDFTETIHARVISREQDGFFEVAYDCPGNLLDALAQIGEMPLPPYIRRPANADDLKRYQTVYAQTPGSVAAPTAGLHFTPELLQTCMDMGVELVQVTLHVGPGTFQPVRASTVEQHQMHTEWYHVSDDAAARLTAAKRDGRRVICIGTTSVRTLESAAFVDDQGVLAVQSGWNQTDIFIYPGYHFKIVDALVTNFHLPKSTLLMLVSALYDREHILAAYQQAVEQNYRFYSYGDAMLIL